MWVGACALGLSGNYVWSRVCPNIIKPGAQIGSRIAFEALLAPIFDLLRLEAGYPYFLYNGPPCLPKRRPPSMMHFHRRSQVGVILGFPWWFRIYAPGGA